MIADELLHTIKQVVAQAMIDQRSFVYGHIASYDPNGHRVRCIVPCMQDDNGQPLETPWMPMGTLSAGQGYGIQVVYQGGATVDKPTNGEQVLIGLFDRHRGVSAVPAMHFHDNAQPPATKLPQGTSSPVAPGDVLISNPSMSLLRLHANGDLEYTGTAKVIVNTTGDVTVATTQGKATVSSQGDATITTQGNASITAKGKLNLTAAAISFGKATGDALQNLCTTALRNWAASHTHPNTGPPTTQPPANGLTSVVSAE